jgi:hypothetical protein
MTQRNTPEYREARRNRRIARKAKALGISPEEYLNRKSAQKKSDQPQVDSTILDFEPLITRLKTLKKLTTVALVKRARVFNPEVSDRIEALETLIRHEFPTLAESYYSK